MKNCEVCGMFYDETEGKCPNCARLEQYGQQQDPEIHRVPQAPEPPRFDQQYGQYGQQPPRQNPAAWPILKQWGSSTMALVIAILVTAAAVLPWVSGSFDLFNVLFAIGLWMIYGAAKSPDPAMNPSGLKFVSGTARAVRIVMQVVAVILFVCGILFLVASGAVANAGLDQYLQYALRTEPELAAYAWLFADIPFALFMSIFAVAFIVIGIVLQLFVIFFYRNVHKLARSVKESAMTGILRIEKADTVRKWCMVLGILAAIGCVSNVASPDTSFLSVLASGCDAAASIVSAVFIKKYMLAPQQPPMNNGGGDNNGY